MMYVSKGSWYCLRKGTTMDKAAHNVLTGYNYISISLKGSVRAALSKQQQRSSQHWAFLFNINCSSACHIYYFYTPMTVMFLWLCYLCCNLVIVTLATVATS